MYQDFDATKYQPKLERLNKADFTTYTFYSPETKQEVTLPAREVKGGLFTPKPGTTLKRNGTTLMFLSSSQDSDSYKEHLAAYKAENDALMEQFCKDLLDAEGLPDNDFTRFLIAKAEEEGHSAGLHEVWNCMSKYTEIYEKAKEFFEGGRS